MKILATNDDGILAEGLWMLVKELKSIAQVAVVAPDREQSATGTSVTLRRPLKVQRVRPLVPDVETYSVEGTPADSVILALGKLIKDKVDLVVSGINQGPNLGDDVLISGTVSAALQGYLRGIPALAISTVDDGSSRENAAKLARLLAEKLTSNPLLTSMFLNVNMPDLPLSRIRGMKLTRLAHKSHIDTVAEDGSGKQKYYWLVRQRLNNEDNSEGTDIWAIEHGFISVTPLRSILCDWSSDSLPESLLSDLLGELSESR